MMAHADLPVRSFLLLFAAIGLLSPVSADPQCASELTSSANVSGLGSFNAILIDLTCNGLLGQTFSTLANINWHVTANSASDTFQILMYPPNVVVPIVGDNMLLFTYGQGVSGTQAGVEIIYPSTATYAIAVEDVDSAVQATFINPAIVSTATTTQTLIVSSTADVTLRMDSTDGNLNLIAPTSTLAIVGKTLNLDVKGDTRGSIEGVTTNLLLEGSAAGGLAVEGVTLNVEVNGGSCADISLDGVTTSCTTTQETVQPATLSCLSTTSSVSVRCNADGSYNIIGPASPVAPSPTAASPVAPSPVAFSPVAPSPVAPSPVPPSPVPPSPVARTSGSLRGNNWWDMTASAFLVATGVVAWW